MASPIPVIDSAKNYCGQCSPIGVPYGEPGTSCCRCSAPVQISSEHIAQTRTLRNIASRLPKLMVCSNQNPESSDVYQAFVAGSADRAKWPSLQWWSEAREPKP